MATPASKTIVATCPECDTKIRFEKQPNMGDLITCRECGETLEVVDLSPLELYWAYNEEFEDDEDWDDDDDEDWEDEDDEDWDGDDDYEDE